MLARLSNRRVQANLAQLLLAVALMAVFALLATTLTDNLARFNQTTGFGFLGRPAGMRMGESVIPFEPTDSFAYAMFAGAVNTVRVSVAAIVLATILGTSVGIMRLSGNPLLRTLTTAYVELFRNTPLLLQILFWSALLLRLPGIRQAVDVHGILFLSQRGLQSPSFTWRGDWLAAWPAMAASVAALLALHRRRAAAATLAAIVLVAGLFLTGSLGIVLPVKKLFGFTGGMTLTPEFCALLAGLTVYAGTFIAEIVRAGILAIPRGQWEAARSLGLRDLSILRKIVLPQALRIILPSMTSQYVGIIKNSTLAIAIGFPDLFWAVSTSINVTGHAIEGVAVLMAAYLVLTLGTSGAMNGWHGRMLRQGAVR